MDNQHRSFPHPLLRLPRAGDREIRQKDIRALPISRERKCCAMQQSSSKQDRIAQYKALIARLTPKSKVGQGALRAFWVGGAICVLGQVISDIGTRMLGLTLMQASSLTSVTLVFLTALLTGIGVFDVIAKYAGAGTVVPITGFANAMVSPAMEFRPEGWVLGTGARLFTIAGPVLVYGVSASVIVGIVYYFIYL